MIQGSISFVVLTWNSAKCIGQCVESVLGLGHRCLELHVVDNGSTDDTLEIIRDYAIKDDRVQLHMLKSNCGTTRPRNIALKSVSKKATHICVLDSDTVVNLDAFEYMLDCLGRHPDVGVIGPRLRFKNGDPQLSGRNLPTISIKVRKAIPFGSIAESGQKLEEPRAAVVDGLQDVGYLLSACWLFPSETLEHVGLLDEHIFYAPEDVDWCLRCHKAGLRVCCCPDAVIIHEYQRLSHKKVFSRINFEHLKGLVYFFKKHGYIFKAPQFEQKKIP